MSDPAPIAAPLTRSRVAAVLAAASGRRRLAVGDLVDARIHRVVLDGPGAHAVLDTRESLRIQGESAALKAARRLVFVGGAPQPREEARTVIDFARKHNLELALDPDRCGLPGVVAADLGLVGADDVVAGRGTDVGGLGGLGCVALRPPIDALAALMGARTLPVPVPNTIYVEVEGRLPRWVGPTELALAGVDAAGGIETLSGCVLEFSGATIAGLTIPERLNLCETLACVGVAGIVPPDDATEVWLRARASSADRATQAKAAAQPGTDEDPEGGAGPAERRVTVAARQLGFTAVTNLLTGRVVEVGKGRAIHVQQVVLSGRVEDLRVAVDVARERRVKLDLAFYWRPASHRHLLHAVEEGLVADLLRAGGQLLSPGTLPPALSRGERRATTTRFDDDDVLVGPAVAAAASISGQLSDPESMRKGAPRAARTS